MTQSIRTRQLGKATVSIINIGDLYLPLAGHMNIPQADLDKHDSIRNQERIPIQFFHIQLPHTSVLIDAGLYDTETHPQYAIEGYIPPASLIEQLSAADIPLDAIDHVVITHGHWDHFNGTTIEQDGQFVPQFPNATYYLGKADWEHAKDALQDANSVESETIKVLYDAGMLTLIDSETEIADGVQIIPTPGETPGHQIVCIRSDGKTLYVLGDLVHHEIEFVDVSWAVSWATQESIVPSRELLIQRALADGAHLMATHITDIGRLAQTDDGVIWEVAPNL